MAEPDETVIWLRPERAAAGRPAERSRAEITAAALDLADREGLDAVSMRRVAALLGTGAASLYRYIATRDDLLDLMTDATGAEYDLPRPTGDWRADLLAVARQTRQIMRRHPWLPPLVITRPALGPHAADVLERVLELLADHPAPAARKLEAFALLNAMTALFVQNEPAAATPSAAARRTAYLRHVSAAGTHPRIAAALADLAGPAAGPDDTDPFDGAITRVLNGLLG
ncbi:TetR/AcrR family transcriptional regulator [Kitasatospora sp. RB6PN24]|uniref:TetR/AcrR family transcriptional regulator n=1 Tax=Kitasatospora humi TaxID=2893891 RepID=UPI001E2954EF|nr:TetR/AcrR family transcriptional regulator [Kitasatospora humi]MCC9309487.1 TetR/AcrR family transcriptional regulator [Kitasatospora humi]